MDVTGQSWGERHLNETDGKTLTCGLLAHPAGHTLSPLIHNTLACMTGKNLVYVPFDVEPESIGDAVKGAFSLNILGMNATVPHKEAVIPYLKEIDPLAEKIGAVNTLVRTADGTGYKGYNTDMTGLKRSLMNQDITIKGQKVIILGAGGVARAVAFLMASEGAEVIYVLNRTVERAEELIKEVGGKVPGSSFVALPMDQYDKIPSDDKYLCIQSTSVGMHPNNDKAIIEDPKFYELVHTGFDIVYRPMNTKFMQLAARAGAKVCNGLEMLLYQGVDAYELWTGCSITKDQCDIVYKAMCDRLENEKNIVLVGYMGSGKSTVSKVLARKLSYEKLDTDSLIEETYETSISDIFASRSEAAFRDMETRQLELLNNEKHDGLVLATGGGLPLREINRRLLSKLGKVVYLKASPEAVYMRIKGDTTRPLLQVEDPQARIKEMLDERNKFYEMAADIVIDTDGKEPEAVADEIIKAMGLL